MIRINLRPGGEKRKAGGGFQLPAFGDLLGSVKDPLLAGVAGAWVVGAIVLGVLYVPQRSQLSSLRDQRTTVEREALRYRGLIAEMKRSSDTRDSLLVELDAIREIDADRLTWPHILDEVTKALPDFTWLQSVEALAVPTNPADSTAKPPVQFVIDGRTSDMQAYTRFVSELQNSPWVRRADFGAVQQIIEEGRTVHSFTVTVTFQTADSAFIRTVPLTASVR